MLPSKANGIFQRIYHAAEIASRQGEFIDDQDSLKFALLEIVLHQFPGVKKQAALRQESAPAKLDQFRRFVRVVFPDQAIKSLTVNDFINIKCLPQYARKLKKAQTGDLVIATTSEDAEGVCKAVAWLGKDEVAVSTDAYIFHHNQNPKYISYLFQTDMFLEHKKRYATGTKVIRVSGENMGKFCFPLPPLAEQERIVAILDNFETLVNDISVGLPAEIEARRKQYEYYRNKLLTFKRKSA